MRPNLAGPALAGLFCMLLVAGCIDEAVANVDLGRADDFAILAGSGIPNTGTTHVTGDIGSHPTPAQTGFETVVQAGTNHHDNATTQGAKADLVAAYDDAKERTGATPIPGGELGGLILPPGVYSDTEDADGLSITGALVLDGLNQTDAVFIFQSGSTLITASNSTVRLINGAKACNVFWQVTSSATLGSGSHFQGSILALTSITLDVGAVVDGRALARNGAVTLHNNTVSLGSCDDVTQIPVFPTSVVAFVAVVGALGGAYLVLRKRR